MPTNSDQGGAGLGGDSEPSTRYFLDAAQRYTARGWAIFPCKPGDKRPHGGLVPHGLKEASTDPVQIEQWWTSCPDADIGVTTGQEFDVLDVDDNSGGWRSLVDLIDTNGCLPSSPVALTPRNGAHYYFAPTGHGNRAALRPGLDWHGLGGYVLAPPPLAPMGISTGGASVRPRPTFLPAPDWLLEILTRPTPPPMATSATITPSGAYRAVPSRGARTARRRSRGAEERPTEQKRSRTWPARRCRRSRPGCRGRSTARNCCPYRPERVRSSGDHPLRSVRRHAQSEVRGMTVSHWSDPGQDEAFPDPPQAGAGLDAEFTGPDGVPLTDLGNARRLVARYGTELLHAPQLGQWLAWDDTRWAEDLTGAVSRRTKAVLDDLLDIIKDSPLDRRKLLQQWLRSQSAPRIAAAMELASTEPGVPVLLEELDRDANLLNCHSGIINLETGELLPHDKSFRMTKLAPVAYQPGADAPRFLQFLDEIFDSDAELIDFVQRFVGYGLTGEVREHTMVFCYGTGQNGKSTLLNTLRTLAGDYGIQLDPAVLMVSGYDQHPTGLTDLRGARFVTTIETEGGKRLAEALVKQLTGGDRIRARRMRQDYFEFLPSHKILFAGNHLPRIRGTDVGIWRRICLVPFDVQIPDSQKDATLGDKLEAELPGILAWAVEGAVQWYRNGLQVPDASSERRSSTESKRTTSVGSSPTVARLATTIRLLPKSSVSATSSTAGSKARSRGRRRHLARSCDAAATTGHDSGTAMSIPGLASRSSHGRQRHESFVPKEQLTVCRDPIPPHRGVCT